MIDREWGKSSEKERETRKKDTEEEARESQCCCISKDSGREGFEEASGTSATFWRPPTLLPKGALPGASGEGL